MLSLIESDERFPGAPRPAAYDPVRTKPFAVAFRVLTRGKVLAWVRFATDEAAAKQAAQAALDRQYGTRVEIVSVAELLGYRQPAVPRYRCAACARVTSTPSTTDASDFYPDSDGNLVYEHRHYLCCPTCFSTNLAQVAA